MRLRANFLIGKQILFVMLACIEHRVKSQCLYYKIQNGDTFESIAQAYAYAGVSVPVLASYNPGITSANVQLYNYICVPIAAAAAAPINLQNPSYNLVTPSNYNEYNNNNNNNNNHIVQTTSVPPPSAALYHQSSSCANTYVIQSGNTCYGIATQYGISLQTLLQANRYVNCYNLQIGSTLCIPSPALGATLTTCARSYTIASGDYCSSIATRLSTSVTSIYHCNPHVVIGCTNLYPGQVIKY